MTSPTEKNQIKNKRKKTELLNDKIIWGLKKNVEETKKTKMDIFLTKTGLVISRTRLIVPN